MPQQSGYGVIVARAHSHHRRAAKTIDAQGIWPAVVLAWSRPQPALVNCQILSVQRKLPPFDKRSPFKTHRGTELVEIGCCPVDPRVSISSGRAIRAGR